MRRDYYNKRYSTTRERERGLEHKEETRKRQARKERSARGIGTIKSKDKNQVRKGEANKRIVVGNSLHV